MESHYFSSEILEWVSSFPSYDMHDWVGQVRARRATIFARILTLSLSFLGGEGGGCSDAPKGLTVSEVVVEDGDRGVTEKAAAAALLAHTLYILTPLHRRILFRERLKTLPEAQRTQKLTPWLGLDLATSWRHLHLLQIWQPDGATWISFKFGHQTAPLPLVANLATR